MIGLRRCALMCVSLCAMMFWPASTGAASSALMTVRIHVSGDMHLDRLYQYPAVLHDTGCTLIRQYAPPGKPHAYSYTLTINEAGRQFSAGHALPDGRSLPARSDGVLGPPHRKSAAVHRTIRQISGCYRTAGCRRTLFGEAGV